MATSPILEALRALLTPDLLSRISSLLGESEGSVGKGLGAAFPALLTGLLRRSDDPSTMERLYSLIDDPSNTTSSVLGDLGNVLSRSSASPSASPGSQFLSLLLGDRSSSLASALAGYAGIRPQSSSSLLSLAAPLLMSLLRDRSRQDGLGAAGLARWLGGQRGAIQESLPGALASVFGQEPPARRTATQVPPPVERRAGRPWLWPLLGLLLLGGLWSLLRSPERRDVDERTAPPVSAPAPAARDLVNAQLPDGVALEIPSNGLEAQLIAVLNDPSASLDWIDFDRLLFETDSATLKPESRAQLRDIAAILRAFPSAGVKVGGYTDNQGDPGYNLKLSGERAASVARELAALGVDPSRIEAEGFGEQFPVASNDTEAGRAKNRRTALLVTSR